MPKGNTEANGWTFTQIPIWVICDPDLSNPAKTLLGYLKYRQGADAACWPSKATIAEDLHVSTDTVTRRINELVKAGYVKRIKRPGRSNLYQLIADPGGKEEAWREHEEARKNKKMEDLGDPPAKMQGGDEEDPPAKMQEESPAKMRGGPSRKNATHDDNHKHEKHERELTPHQRMFGRLAELCRIDLEKLTKEDQGKLNKVSQKLLSTGEGLEDIDVFEQYWYARDWRGKQDQPPNPWQVVKEWGRMEYWVRHGKPTNSRQREQSNGHKPRLRDDRSEAEIEALRAEMRAHQGR